MRLWLLPCLTLTGAVLAAGPNEYEVQPGDTLIRVRDRLLEPEVRWQQVQELNRVADPFRLRPGTVLRFAPEWLRERAAQAEVLQVTGTVWRERAGQRERLAAGHMLQDGDRVLSDAQSSASLGFADGTRGLLRPGSHIELLKLRQRHAGARSQVRLHAGALDAQVPPAPAAPSGGPPRFELHTPVAHLGVRGTQFRGRLIGERVGLEVLNGQVQAAALGRGARPEAVVMGEGWVSGRGRESLLAAPALAGVPERVFQRLPLRVQWPAQSGAKAWRVQWLDATGQLVLDRELEQPMFQGGEDLPDGDYRLRVRARSASGLEGLDAELPVQVSARPEPPILQAPAAAAQTYEASVRFAWTRPPDAARYRVQIASDAAFTQGLTDDLRDNPDGRIAVPEGQHHWRVASVRADGRIGPWSDAQQLTRLPLPPSPPPAEPRREGNRLHLRWAASPLPGARYQVQAAPAASDFAAPYLDQVVDGPHISLTLLHSGPQALRMRTLAADGTPGPWGRPQGFDGKAEPPWWLALLGLLVLL